MPSRRPTFEPTTPFVLAPPLTISAGCALVVGGSTTFATVATTSNGTVGIAQFSVSELQSATAVFHLTITSCHSFNANVSETGIAMRIASTPIGVDGGAVDVRVTQESQRVLLLRVVIGINASALHAAVAANATVRIEVGWDARVITNTTGASENTTVVSTVFDVVGDHRVPAVQLPQNIGTTVTTSSYTVAAASLIMGSSVAGAAQRQVLLASASNCPVDPFAGELSRDMSPTGLEVGSTVLKRHLGAALANTGIMLGLLAVVIVFGVVLQLKRSTAATKGFLRSACVHAGFPGRCFGPLLFLLQPTLSTCFTLLLYESHAVETAVGAALGVMWLAGLMGCYGFVWRRLISAAAAKFTTAKKLQQAPAIDRWMSPRGEWAAVQGEVTAFVQMFGTAFEDYNPQSVRMLAVESSFTVISALLLATSPSTSGGCRVHLLLITGVLIMYFVIVALMCPLRTRFSNAVMVLTAGLQCVAAVSRVASLYLDSTFSGSVSDYAILAATVVQLFALLVKVVHAVHLRINRAAN